MRRLISHARHQLGGVARRSFQGLSRQMSGAYMAPSACCDQSEIKRPRAEISVRCSSLTMWSSSAYAIVPGSSRMLAPWGVRIAQAVAGCGRN